MIVKYSDLYVRFLRGRGIDRPLSVSVTSLGVRGVRMGVSRDAFMFQERAGIDRNEVFLPEVLAEGPGLGPEDLKSLLDVAWQACGWEQSLYFKDGKWTPPR